MTSKKEDKKDPEEKSPKDIEYIRADGRCVCPVCGRECREHPMTKDILGWNKKPFLHKLCNGALVKL